MLVDKGLGETVIDSSFGYFNGSTYFEQLSPDRTDLPFLSLFKRSFFDGVL
jgi:hypothetical protein